jgi:hypothetical protein
VTLSQRLHRIEAEDGRVDATGYVGPFCPNFAIFLVLVHKGILVIVFNINRTLRAGAEEST